MAESLTLNSVLVIGGGVAGMTAALDLAEQGHTVYLVERDPSIGGRMAQLDKTFPTLDCSICILAPKMVEISRHPNVKLMAYSEVKSVRPILKGRAFRVEIRRKPRYVDEEKCTGCRVCMEKCPIKAPSEFDEKIGERKAIYIPFPQAVPAVAIIDSEKCLYFQKGVCRICEKFCPANAVSFEQKEEVSNVEVAAIVVATGFDVLNPHMLSQFGYGRFPNVLTSIQYERLINAAGPTGGKIERLSDGVEPGKIAFIQCVGSRDVDVKQYCSQFCCMYATKEAIVTKEHNPKINITIFQNDLRSPGKGHHELTIRAAEEFNIEYVKSLPTRILQNPTTKSLELYHPRTAENKTVITEADLVVLCPAVIPKSGTAELAETLGIEASEYGFLKSLGPLAPVDTGVPGIYLCGVCEGPKDISSSVAQASAAAARAALRTEILKGEPRYIPVEKQDIGKEPRIGVFVCNCGINIGSVINVPEVAEFSRDLKGVVHAEDFLFACSKDAAAKIKEAIDRHDLNRIIVASCTPRTHEPLFRATCEEASLNPYLLEMVNIREHDSWVHSHNPEEATEKAKDLVRMAAARSRLLSPLQKLKTEVAEAAMVIGGGLAGLIAAKTIGDRGFKTYLIEKSEMLREDSDPSRFALERFDFGDVSDILSSLVKQVENHENIEVLLSTDLKEVRGSVGDFDVKLAKGEEQKVIKVGSIILAVDAQELKPKGLYGYAQYDSVLTAREFNEIVGDGRLKDGESIVMILCAGARERDGRTYCSAVCCSEALASALNIRKAYPNSEVYILYRDIVVSWKKELEYRETRNRGITFIRFDESSKPEVELTDGRLAVKVRDVVADVELTLPADKVVLGTPLIPSEHYENLSSILKVSRTTQGFFLEAHPKLRPLDFATDGIHLCGTCHSPQELSETVYQALGAASRALIPLVKGKVVNEPIIAEVDSDLCIACANCEAACEYGAIRVDKVAEVNPFLCKGCGVCAVECPASAITMHHFTDDQLSAMIKAALETPSPQGKPKALAFFCNWCSYAGADMAGVSRFQYPPSFRIIRVMCSGRIDQRHILQAFMSGADGVLIGGCHIGDCHYISGNLKADERVKELKRWLKMVGIEPERLRIEWASAGEGKKVAQIMKDFTTQLEKLGPSPLKREVKVKP